jgi:molybdopterin/thiamine biosynthesis adenylyltransferase
MHVFQVGAGSGGIVVLDLVARDPRVSRVTLVEPDVYKAHNVYRHLFPPAAVGRLKAELAAEWVCERRPDVAVETVVADLTDPGRQADFRRLAAGCDVGICAVDNEPAKYAFDALMRAAGRPWTLGEVLSGGIGGWVHRFAPGGACYGCVAAHLKRTVAEEAPAPAPDYSAPGGPVAETTVPASRASIAVVAGLHATVTLDLLTAHTAPPPEPTAGKDGGSLLPFPPREGGPGGLGSAPLTAPPVREGGAGGVNSSGFTSLLLTLAAVPGVFDVAYRAYRFAIPKAAGCLVCAAGPAPAGEDLDAALDQALARLGDH